MGCGISTLDVEDASLNQRSKARNHAIVLPVVDIKKEFENGDEGGMSSLHGNNNNNNNNNKDIVMVIMPSGDEEAKDEGSNGEKLKEKNVVEKNNNKEEEKVFEIGGKEKPSSDDEKCCAKNNVEEHEDGDDNFIVGPASPSFREYCNDYDCGGQSSMRDSNDCDSMESIKNDEDDSIRKNTPKEGSANSNKHARHKKERRVLGFRNVINKGKTRGRRNLLNFACYNGSNESYAEGSFNKMEEKTA